MPEYTFESSQPVLLRARLPRGHLRVTAADVDTITVSVEPFDPDDARAVEAAQRVKVEMSGRTLFVESPDRGALLRWAPPKLTVTAAVPTRSDVAAKVASADVETTGLLGSLRLASASGDLTGEDFTGDVSIRNAAGEVTVGAVGGSLSMNTASGSAHAVRVARDVRMKAASGDLDVADAGGSVRGHNASGDIRVGRASAGRIDVQSASGSVSVGVADGVGVWMDLRSFSGEVTSDLPVADAQPERGCALEIRAQSMSGDVRVHRAGRTAGPTTTGNGEPADGPPSPKVLA